MNLYLKWAMTFRSPHPFFSFLFFFFFLIFFIILEKKKRWPSFIPTHQNLLFVPNKTHLECLLSSLQKALPLVSKVRSIFIFILKWALPLVEGLGQLVQKDFTFNPHWALGEPTHAFRVLGYQKFPKAWIGSQLFNKVYNILMILGSLAFEKDF